MCASAFAPYIDRVTVDRVQIQQVILNFIRNAIEAMEGQPRGATSQFRLNRMTTAW